MSIIFPVILAAAVGTIAGAGLSAAAEFIKTENEGRVEALTEALPGANCGGCGYSGCEGYAVAVAGGGRIDLCTPGGAETAARLAEIMGVEAVAVVSQTALVHCRGDINHTDFKAKYRGIETCEAASLFLLGPARCSFGCAGLGDCAGVCVFGAITVKNGLASVDTDRCTGCGTCVKSCPKKLITLWKEGGGKATVLCKSCDAPAETRNICQAGCISCRLCLKACGEGAITIENNLATVNPEKCTDCGKCVDACPTGVIVK